MVQDFTLHTHTVGFDGRNSVAEMVKHAATLGFKAIGISNHFIVHPDIKNTMMYRAAIQRGYDTMYAASFDEVMSRFKPHYAALENAAAAADIRVLRGMEVDFFPTAQWRDGFTAACEILKPDYIIGSAHFVNYGGHLNNTYDLKRAPLNEQNKMLDMYWENVANAARSGLFNFMAHLDLMKKMNLGRGDEWIWREEAALDAIMSTNTAIEINTSGIERMGEVYPSNRILRAAAQRDIPVVFSDDAHEAAQIGRDFNLADEIARAAGIKKRPSLDKILNIRRAR